MPISFQPAHPYYTPPQTNILTTRELFDPLENVKLQMELSKIAASQENAKIQRRIDQMSLEEAERKRELGLQTEQLGEDLLRSLGQQQPPAPTAGPTQEGQKPNALAPYGPTGVPLPPPVPPAPSRRTTEAATGVRTPYGAIEQNLLQKYPVLGGRLLLEQRKIDAARQQKLVDEKLAEASKRVSEFIASGNDTNLQAYRKYLETDPITKPLADQLGDIKLTGTNEFTTQKFYSPEMLNRLDPTGKLTDGTPGIYTEKHEKNGKISLTKVKTDRDMLLNSALNGTPEERAWAVAQLQGRESLEPWAPQRSFHLAESEKIKKEHPNWSRAEVESEVFKRWRNYEIEKAKASAAARIEGTKEGWSDEVKRIGDSIMSGKQPPELSGFGMARVAPQVRAYLAEQGYDFYAANMDWLAQKKFLTTANSGQQLRLRQAINFTKHSLDIIDELARKWDAGPYPLLNKANLMAAIHTNAYGPEAAKIAAGLIAQVNDLVSELGTVYKSGNSSTDKSLELAAENLKSEWSKDVLQANVELVRRNLGIRENSIRTTKPILFTEGFERSATKELKEKAKVGDPESKQLLSEMEKADKKLGREEEKPSVMKRKPGETIPQYLMRMKKEGK